MKIKGTTTIELRDAKTGEVTKRVEHNLITKAVEKWFANCGMLNYPNADMSDLVQTLYGGIMAFDTALTEDADIVTIPEGVKMIANGCIGVDNVSEVLEFGSYSDTESSYDPDTGVLVQVYDYGTSQANGTIATVCVTNKDHAYMGEGNSVSPAGTYMSAVRNQALTGTSVEYLTRGGIACGVDLVKSICYSVDFSDISNGNITIRKLRLPIDTINPVGTPSAPAILAETTISAPAQLVTELTRRYNMLAYNAYECMQDNGSKLCITSLPNDGSSGAWGTTYTQYLWELDYINGTITESTILNTSGEDLHGILKPVWLDADTLAWIDGYMAYSSTYNGTKIYYCHRTSGTWGTIGSIVNPVGSSTSYPGECGWCKKAWSSGQRGVVSTGTSSQRFLVVDASNGTAYVTNGYVTNFSDRMMVPTNSPLILAEVYKNSGGYWALKLWRNQGYIASINVLGTPVVKDNTKTMKITYRLTFSDSEV